MQLARAGRLLAAIVILLAAATANANAKHSKTAHASPGECPNPERAGLYLSQGINLGDEGRDTEALRMFKMAQACDPWDPKIRYNLGVSLETLGHQLEALDEYREAVNLDPDYTLAWGNRGVTAYNTQRYEEARDAFDKALCLDPNYFDTRPDQLKMYEKSADIAPKTVALRREVNVRFSPNIGYLINVGDQLKVDRFMYLLLDGGVDVQIWRNWFATFDFLYGHTKWNNNMQGDGMNIFGPTFGIKYVLMEYDWTRPKDTPLDKSRYWFSLSVGPYITHLSAAAASNAFTDSTKKVDVGANLGAGFEYYFHPNVGAGLQVKLHYIGFDENYFIFTAGPCLVGRF
ncbi:MAG: tetratricopeptide repeat protein [bacterium]